jgi:biopolymer transport protein ExbD
MPTVNLVPMMTAMLAILAFFVVLSTSLTTSEQTAVQLPPAGTGEATPSSPTTPALSILLDRDGQVTINRRPVAIEMLEAEVSAYMQQFPDGSITLDADPQLPYEQVLEWLERLKQVTGNRVTLAIAQPAP